MFCISLSYGSHPSGQTDVWRTKHSLHTLKRHPVNSFLFPDKQTNKKGSNMSKSWIFISLNRTLFKHEHCTSLWSRAGNLETVKKRKVICKKVTLTYCTRVTFSCKLTHSCISKYVFWEKINHKLFSFK